MKKIISIIFIFCNLTLFSQNIELYGGFNKNIFFDYNQNDGHYSSSYKSDLGYSIGIGIDSVKIDWLKFRFTLNYDYYGGNIESSYTGLAGGNKTIMKIKKNIISIGIYPINIKIIDRIDFNLGIKYSRLINEDFSGINNMWSMNQFSSFKLQDRYDNYSAKTYFGFQGRIAYGFKLSDKLTILPQYSYYYSLSYEFDEFPIFTKSMRHYFNLGIKIKI